jgi:hypothetical protein
MNYDRSVGSIFFSTELPRAIWNHIIHAQDVQTTVFPKLWRRSN